MRSRLPFRSALTLLSSPVALLATGCVTRPWTPAVPLANWSETPQVTNYEMPAQGDALRRWQIPPGDPWGPYAKYTLLTSVDASPTPVELPDVNAMEEVAHARAAARRIAEQGMPADTMWVVDLRGAASVAFGATLSRTAVEPVRLVPTFNNWPATDELIPAEETLAALTTMTPRPPEEVEGGARPVFLLDAWRLAYRFEEPADDTYDNRYILTSSDLPDVETLRRNGIRRIVYLVSSLDDVAVEEDDVHATFLEWERSGIPIAMVDVSAMEGLVADAWDEIWQDDALIVEPRITLVEEPGFYVRARGGFGGLHARPSPVHVGGSWTGHGGYGGWHGAGG